MSRQSLRYLASVQLHRLDQLVSQFQRCRVELIEHLQRSITQHGQMQNLRRRQESIASRGYKTNSTTEQALLQLATKTEDAEMQVRTTLENMRFVSDTVFELFTLLSRDVGQIHTNSNLDSYGRESDTSNFAYEYQELQRAMEIINEQAKKLSSEVRLKLMQYKHCPMTEFPRLLKAWSSIPATHDQEMDDLAAMILT